MTNFTFAIPTSTITLADDTELKDKFVNLSAGFLFVYDAPEDEEPTIYSSSMIKTIEVKKSEEEEITEENLELNLEETPGEIVEELAEVDPALVTTRENLNQ